MHHDESMYGYEIKVKDEENGPLIEVLDTVASSEYPIGHEELIAFRFTEGNLEVVSRLINKALIPALVEVTGQDVQEHNKFILFDVDGDGVDEEIFVSYWERWGVANIVEIETSSIGPVIFSTGCSRIGFIPTKTNGLHDIVCGRSDILKYNDGTNRYE